MAVRLLVLYTGAGNAYEYTTHPALLIAIDVRMELELSILK